MMTILTRSSDRQTVSLGNKIASSGEGEVWETNFSGTLAKIYHDPTPERIAKLKAMLANPPVDPMASRNHISIAFPQDLLLDGSGSCVGFLMPAVRSSRELPSIYHPRLRKKNAPGFNWYYLHVTALNTAWIIQAIHEKGYVLGDIKSQNILVNDRALVAVIDTDSFQVRDSKTGKVYRCTVGSDGFTPVELLGKDFSTTDQTEICDRFRLAVLIHYLLFGYHPFSGEWTGAGESPDQTELIRKGFWYGGKNSLIRPSQTTIPLDVVHPEIKRLFLKCFNDGHASPKLRPTAEDWHNALQAAVNDLVACSHVDSHHYSRNYGKCNWCERLVTLGVDIFPGGLVTATTAVKATIPSTVIQPIPFSTLSSKATTPVSQLSSSTALPTIQAFSKSFLNSQKRWQIFIGLGLGGLAFSAAALNLPSSKQISHSSTPPISPQIGTPINFLDVPQDYWARPYIDALSARRIVNGYAGDYFRPNQTITRTEFAALLQAAFDNQPVPGTTEYKDIPTSFWGIPAINSATRTGFLTGYPGNIFRPIQEIPRVQVLVALASGLNLTPSTSPEQVLQAYGDATEIPNYAREKVAAATNAGLVANYPDRNSLAPNRSAKLIDF